MDFLNDIFQFKDQGTVCGLSDELQILYYLTYFNRYKENTLIVTNSLYDSNKIFQKLKTYTDDVFLFPMDDFLASVAVALSPDLKVKRLEVLERIKEGKKSIIVTNLMGYLRYLPSLKEKDSLNIKLSPGLNINRDNLIDKLITIGYKQTSLVTSTGEYAVRGYIIDIFPIEEEHPIRIEFFGDEIDNIRFFDESTQLSLDKIKEYNILPFQEVISDEHNSLYDYLDNPNVFYVDYNQILNGYNKIVDDIKSFKESKHIENEYKYMYDIEEIVVDKYIKIETINNLEYSDNYNSKPIIKFKGDYERFKDYCYDHYKNNTLVICLSKEKQIERIKDYIPDINLGPIEKGKINVVNKKINEGFIIDKYIYISEYDIDDQRVYTNYKTSYKMGKKINDYNELHIGDYVVHTQHGIGIYGGITAITKGEMVRDYILINYQGNDKVYIPVEKISTIYKYADQDGVVPHINKLNSTSWAKTKLRVRNRIHDISEELIKLYAARANTKGPVFKTYEDEVLFGDYFEYDETSDQLKSINEVDKDLRSPIPMDRLLCGDVGFGKTEVAFRGIFKAVMNGYQVAYLCPTTLLSRQQYNNALDRFKDFPINIALLNRFTSVKEQNRIYKDLSEGKIDILFGTHKLFNEKINYKSLGLLIIDEEQRFGVTHKEKIKEIKNDVNVLTLSATPIPRTLKMAMSGLRDLSIIDTAPVDRYPVQTYVLEENDVLIKDAVYKELARDGQVFILYNRVQDIEDFRSKIQLLIPEATIAVAHGKMDKDELEGVVSDFVDNKYNILICTTIIETGIDIPNVNTLIVIDADSFGLAQLYQLRGRVGRSNKIAYAYLMYKPAKVLTETAIKRLQSIKDFTELGSGYKIAMRDLSIRGAGDILGSEQAGFIDSIGIDLYTQMVNEEIKKLNGEDITNESEDTGNPLIEVSNHISDNYVSEESIKIEIHKMINNIKDKESLELVKHNIEDRFGKIDNNMEIYMYEEWFEKLANKLSIKRVDKRENIITIELPPEISDNIDGEKLFLVTYSINPRYKLKYQNKRIYITLPTVGIEKHFIYYEVKLLDEIVNMIKKDD